MQPEAPVLHSNSILCGDGRHEVQDVVCQLTAHSCTLQLLSSSSLSTDGGHNAIPLRLRKEGTKICAKLHLRVHAWQGVWRAVLIASYGPGVVSQSPAAQSSIR